MGTRVFILSLLLAAAGQACPSVKVANPELLEQLAPEEQAVLAKQGIVGQATELGQMYDVYEAAADGDLPIFVTVDPLLHTFHVLYDRALMAAEMDNFYPAAQRMLELLLVHQQRQLVEADNPVVRAAMQDNVAYLSVPLALLDSGFRVPDEVEAKVRQEVALVEAHAGGAVSPVMNYSEDFSQYKPRGHYDRTVRFRRYFKAMMYLGRMTFRLDTTEGRELTFRHTRQAILLAEGFGATGADSAGVTPGQLWERVYEPTAWLVGEADDLLPREYDSLFAALAGGDEAAEWVASDDNIRRFIAAAESLRKPSILSDIVMGGLPGGMRLMGQRYIPDAHVFHNLTFDRIPGRMLPMGLDVMAVLGSDRARELLVDVFRQDRYPGYVAKLDSMRLAFDALTPGDWNRNIYYGWLYALKLNLEPVGLPRHRSLVARFTQSPAYADKTLVAACGSWTELRHDTMLYAKQSYTSIGLGRIVREEPRDRAYVEPKPQVFGHLAQLTESLGTHLAATDDLNPEVARKLPVLAATLARLAAIAEAEQRGQELTGEDAVFCKSIGRKVGSLVTFSEDFVRRYESPVQPDEERPSWVTRVSGQDTSMALVADVHTDPNTGLVLEEAVGHPVKLYAVIPFYGKQYVAVGAGYSYYEFAKPMAERMTDEEWRALRPKPPMPSWTRSFIPLQPTE